MNADLDTLNDLHGALLDLTGLLNRPQPDALLLEKSGISLDRALFPILSRVGERAEGIAPTIDELAELSGRDQSTVSRQVTRLEQRGLATRRVSASDHRRREVVPTEQGRDVLAAIGRARGEMLEAVLQDWSASEREELVRSLRRLVGSARGYLREAGVRDSA